MGAFFLTFHGSRCKMIFSVSGRKSFLKRCCLIKLELVLLLEPEFWKYVVEQLDSNSVAGRVNGGKRPVSTLTVVIKLRAQNHLNF